jgi:hypothetical protein
MGFFDFLSGSDDAERAAEANRAAAQDAYNRSGSLAGTYQTGALGQLGQGLTSATGALNTGLANQLGAYSSALGSATDAGRAGIAAYAPLSALGSKYGGATTSLLNALGVNGPGAFNVSIDQFRNSPGYQFQQDEAERAAGNAASKLGIAGSGNTLQAISDRAGKIADTTWGQNFLQPLSQFISPELQATAGAASGVAGANQNLANIYQNYGQQTGGAYGANAAGLAGLYSGAGESGANVLGNIYGGQTQASQNLATGNIQANNLVAQAGMQDASNFWNLLGNLGKGVTAAAAPGISSGIQGLFPKPA